MGGGLTGCATAYACAAAGLRPVVLEAGRIGWGSAGRSAGLLLSDPGVAFRGHRQGTRAPRGETHLRGLPQGVRRRGLRRCVASTSAATSRAVTMCSWGFATERRTFNASATRARTPGSTRNGSPAQSARTSMALDAVGAIKPGPGFTLDPYRACLGLASAARSRGGTLFERSPGQKGACGPEAGRRDRGWRRDPRRQGDRDDGHRDGRVQAASPPLQDARDVPRADRAAALVDAEAAGRRRPDHSRHGIAAAPHPPDEGLGVC